MARSSTRENKTVYQLRREELGLTREKASELLEGITPERIERIESEKYLAHPDEILLMAEIGKKYVPQITIKDLPQIVLEILASLNAVKCNQERLIEITADGFIQADEVEDFIKIQRDLERISLTVDALQLWTEKKLASGEVDIEAYNAAKERLG